ncbi:FRG domain-containing protein [Thalassospira profundimaris]|uniref:FRG domain-containing protein n=1 Tax=Thalassospira profundimaris TaxID=502049 RepID=UPI000287264F|nr:FRG domain-containing protein [Thalassospira profundimaris]EKF06519.1 hypothetical protein TH2_19348 [Thalassospira profundimaris WP0211]
MDRVQRGRLEHALKAGHAYPVHPDGLRLAGVDPIDQNSHWEYRCRDAKTLLEILDVQCSVHQLPANGELRTFYYRGHRDASWPLLPSVFRSANGRDGSNNNFDAHYHGGDQTYEINQYCNFLEAVNSQGMFIEEEAFELLRHHRQGSHDTESWVFRDLNSKIVPTTFPSSGQLRTLALAQHYGIPTRLLDWTKNPYVALFMATEAIDSVEEMKREINFGIWMIPKVLFDVTSAFKYFFVIDVSKFQNANISAQHGCFSLHIPPLEDVLADRHTFPVSRSNSSFMHLDEYLCDSNGDALHEEFLNRITGKPMLLTLKSNEVGLIRQKLDQLQMNWTTLMPNLDGAAKEALRRQRMDRIIG